jgi:hypothetical protein
VYEVEVGYPVVGYQQTKGNVEQGRVHQVHLRHTENTKNCSAHILLVSDLMKILLSHFVRHVCMCLLSSLLICLFSFL